MIRNTETFIVPAGKTLIFFKRRIVLLFCLMLLISYAGVSSYAFETSLKASVSPEKGTVGQPITYTLAITGIDPGSLKIALPEKKIVFPEKKNEGTNIKNKSKNNSADEEKKPEEFVPLYIIKSASRDDSEAEGAKIVSIKIILTFYRPGTYKLPEIIVKGSDGISIAYNIPSVIIEEVNKEGKLEEIEPPISLSGNYTRIIWIIASLLLAAAFAFALFYYLKKRRKPEIIETPPLPPIEIFLNEVESLKLRELIEKGMINEYVFDISIIFRRFLSAMLVFDAAEMTTDEIASKIKKYMPHELYVGCGEEIISNMRLWDFSKFAEFTPSRDLLLQNLEDSVSVAKKISDFHVNPENGRSENGTVRV